MSGTRPLIRVTREHPGPSPGEQVEILHIASLTAAALWTVHSMEEETIVSFAPSVPNDRELTERFIAASDVVMLTEADARWLHPGATVEAVIEKLLRGGPALVAVECAAGWTLGTKRASLALPAALTAERLVAGLLNGLTDVLTDGSDVEGLRSGLDTAKLARIGRSVAHAGCADWSGESRISAGGRGAGDRGAGGDAGGREPGLHVGPVDDAPIR